MDDDDTTLTTPLISGYSEMYTITGLSPNSSYSFRLKGLHTELINNPPILLGPPTSPYVYVTTNVLPGKVLMPLIRHQKIEELGTMI